MCPGMAGLCALLGALSAGPNAVAMAIRDPVPQSSDQVVAGEGGKIEIQGFSHAVREGRQDACAVVATGAS